MAKDGGAWEKSFFDRAIQGSIGRALRAHLDVPQKLPDDLSELLRQMEEQSGDEAPRPKDDEQKGAGARPAH